MAFNAQESVNNILNLKGDWEKADEEERNKIQERAKKHYNDLIGNGYGDWATTLRNSNYTQAQEAAKQYKTSGMTPMRDYLKQGLVGQFGMSPEKADSIIEYKANGDVHLGGVNVGRGDAMANDRYYVKDSKRLDDALKQYADRAGLQKDVGLMYNQGQQQMQDKTNELWGLRKEGYNTLRGYTDDYMGKVYGNPFETDAGKSILNYYAQAGEKAGYNQIASGAGSNGGNKGSD